jgi:UPF0755 protein
LKKLLLLALLLALLISGGAFYITTQSPAWQGEQSIEILLRRDDPWSVVENQLSKHEIRYAFLIKPVAIALKYDTNIKPGRYLIVSGSTILDIIRKLRSGNQDAVNLTLNNITFLSQLAGKVAGKLDIDSTELIATLQDRIIAEKYGFSQDNFGVMFLCNTYSFFWNTSIDGFLDRMNLEYNRFWNAERLSKAQQLKLSPEQIIILASIVNKETNYRPEYARVAGVYLNRLEKGMPLQADPTVKFAVGDMGLRRILNTHLQTDSPYNTYQRTGLPPGPICLPELDVINGVLNAEQHKYLYFCAIYGSGQHAFAVTYDEHLKNARKYHQALNAQKIYR